MSSNEKIGLKEKISFAFANMGNIPVTALVNSFLLIFYTNVVGLDPACLLYTSLPFCMLI